eukprot:jgi/Chlat1/8026/Chrsp7S07772
MAAAGTARSGQPSVSSSALTGVLASATPVALSAVGALRAVVPAVAAVWRASLAVYAKLQPYHPEEWLPMIFGLVMVFFGGRFLTLIAAVEAYRIVGWSSTQTALQDMVHNFKLAQAASHKDDKVDANRDGIADVLQISNEEWARRKIALALKSVDPNRLSTAIGALYAGLMAVVAALRIRFAKTIALGTSIGDICFAAVNRVLGPAILPASSLTLVPREYAKWVPVLLHYACKLAGVSLAWFIQRIISSFHSALRGAHMFTKALLEYCARRGKFIDFDNDGVSDINESSITFIGIAGAFALFGFYQQISNGFGLPFPLSLLLLPLDIAEWFLMWLVAVEE